MFTTFKSANESYILGVFHGDGHVGPRSVGITVGYQDAHYAGVLIKLFKRFGLNPKLYRKRSALSVEVHSLQMADAFRKWKRNGKWKIPSGVDRGNYLAGVFDTDGHVSVLPMRRVYIGLKRSGNLKRILLLLESIGLSGLRVAYGNSKYNGKLYPKEEISIYGMSRVVHFAHNVRLRHPRKIARLSALLKSIAAIRAHVPLWVRVAKFCNTPKTWKQISERFRITKRQADTALLMIKANTKCEIIPPIRMLTKYRVSNLSYSRHQ